MSIPQILLLLAASPGASAPLPVSLPVPEDAAVRADEKRDDIIVSASGAPQAAETVAQAVTVINRQTIEQRQTIVLADLLATTPGVTVTRNGGIGGFTGVRIRGAEAEQTLVLIDGVRVNDPSSPGGGFDFGTLLSGAVERVEVLRGPNAVAWGSQAIGGVVDIITEAPTEQLSARASAEGGYAGSAFASARVSGGVGPVRASLTGGYLRTDGISAAASGTERDGYRQYGATGRVEVALSDAVGLDLRGYYAGSRTAIDGFPAPDFRLADTPEFSTAQELYGYAGLRLGALGGRFRNRVSVAIADINRDNFDAAGIVTPAFLARGRTERYAYQGDLDLGPVRGVIGAEHEASRLTDGDTAAATGITSGYAQAIVQPVRALTLTGGVRYDSHRSFGGNVSLGANAALGLGRGTVLRASYGDGFKAPTLFQLFSFFGTPTLRPETARNIDIGAEQRLLNGRLRASVTYFNRLTRNQIDFDLGSFTYANIARARAQGVEVALALTPVDALAVTASYTYVDAQNRAAGASFGNQLARRPRQSLSASADYRLRRGPSIGATVLVVGDSFDDAGNSVRLDGYVVASVRAELPVRGRFTLYGRVDNLFDARYRTVAGYGTYPRSVFGGVRVKLD